MFNVNTLQSKYSNIFSSQELDVVDPNFSTAVTYEETESFLKIL